MSAVLDGTAVNVTDPRELLLGYLDWYREALLRKLAGLSDAASGPGRATGLVAAGSGAASGLGGATVDAPGFAAEDVVAY